MPASVESFKYDVPRVAKGSLSDRPETFSINWSVLALGLRSQIPPTHRDADAVQNTNPESAIARARRIGLWMRMVFFLRDRGYA